jgi:hypothetical protein
VMPDCCRRRRFADRLTDTRDAARYMRSAGADAARKFGPSPAIARNSKTLARQIHSGFQ